MTVNGIVCCQVSGDGVCQAFFLPIVKQEMEFSECSQAASSIIQTSS